MKIRKIVSMIGVAALAAASFMPFTPVTPAQAGTVRDLREGETAPAGSTLVVEVVDFGPRTIHINPGVGPVTERVEGLVHTNVWIVDASLEQALCEQARERFTEAQIPGGWANNPTPMQVFLKGSPFSGTCEGAPVAMAAPAPAPSGDGCTGDSYVRDLNNGQSSPAGKFVILEVVDHGSRHATITAMCSPGGETERVDGSIHYNVWWGYGSLSHAMRDACKQAAERRSEASKPGSWFEGGTVETNAGC